MRKVGLAALLVVATMGFARVGSAATHLTFTNDGLALQGYSVEAVGDDAWFGVAFAVTVANAMAGHDAGFDLTFGVPSGAGNSYSYTRSSGGFAANTPVSLGTLTLAVAGGLGPAGTHTLADLNGSFLFAISDTNPTQTNSFTCTDGTPCNVPGESALSITIVNVPEPTTLALLGIGLSGLAFLRRRTA